MKQRIKTLLAIITVIAMIMGSTVGIYATNDTNRHEVLNKVASDICEKVKNPQVGSIGGEWAVLGLARSGCDVPKDYFDNYYVQVEKHVMESKGVLHEKKYTEYSRLILALTAIGRDPSNVAGYNLLTPLGDYEKSVWQGINGPVWALIALDSKNYTMPQNKQATVQATREKYIKEILSRQLADGGFSLTGGTDDAELKNKTADADITGMVLQALAKYQDRKDVKQATEKALLCLSKMQHSDGGYDSWEEENSESVVQVIVALTELGIPLDDERFVKNGNRLDDNLLSYYTQKNGFKHKKDDKELDQMTTEQAFYALVSIQRVEDGKNSLYRMSDVAAVAKKSSEDATSKDLTAKDQNVTIRKIIAADRTFKDITNHKNKKAIEALAAREIINGKSETNFEPDATMTRAEFATIVVQALGLSLKGDNQFKDVSDKAWYAKYVTTAYEYKIVSGTSEETFHPNGTITREEAASMVARAAKLCGMDTTIEKETARDTLSQFMDYVEAAEWASSSLAFCYSNDILDQSNMEILPKASIKRCEIAEMLYRMLEKSHLL